MEANLHYSRIKAIEGIPSTREERERGLQMERLWIKEVSGEMHTIWLTREQAQEMRAALDKLYPPNPEESEVVERYADEHAGEFEATVGNPLANPLPLPPLRAKCLQVLSPMPPGGYACPACHTDKLPIGNGYCPACNTRLFPVEFYESEVVA